jgi:hypothetical protein
LLAPNVVMVILANKVDNKVERKVSFDTGNNLALKYNALYIEVSSKTSIGLNRFVSEPLERLLQLYKNKYMISFESNELKYVKL